MASAVTDVTRVAVAGLDDEHQLWFQTYTLGNRRFGGVRLYKHTTRYWGPTRAGFDMSFEQLVELQKLLCSLARDVETGLVIPPLEYARIPAGSGSEWVVQVLEPAESSAALLLDIRKHVSTEKYTGFTRKGLRVDFEVIDVLIENIPALCESLQAWREGRWGLFAADGDGAETNEIAEAPDAVPDEYRSYF